MSSEDHEFYGDYRILRREDGQFWELGPGSMGVTYKAIHVVTTATVALKVISPYLLLDQENAAERFRHEAQAAAKMSNRYIAKVHHFGHANGKYFYTMDFVEGRTIKDIVERDGPMPWPRALTLALQVAGAFAEMYKAGVVHRDIQPANIMVVSEADLEEIVKLIDFGLVKSVREGSGPSTMGTHRHDSLGTPHYSSPEQCRNQVLDICSDIYSLGVTLWFMLTGKPTFHGDSVLDIQIHHVSTPPPLDSLPPSVPGPVRTLLGRMLAKEPKNRPRDPAALIQEIKKCQRDSLAESARVESTGGVTASSPYAFALDDLLRRRQKLEWNEIERLTAPLLALAQDLSVEGTEALAAFIPRFLRVVFPTVPQSSMGEEILRSGLGYDHPLRWPEFRLESTFPPEKRRTRFDATRPPLSRRFQDAPHAVAAVAYELLAGTAPGPDPKPLRDVPPAADDFLRRTALYRMDGRAKPEPPPRVEDPGKNPAPKGGWLVTIALLVALTVGGGIVWQKEWIGRLTSRQEPSQPAAPTATASPDQTSPRSRAPDAVPSPRVDDDKFLERKPLKRGPAPDPTPSPQTGPSTGPQPGPSLPSPSAADTSVVRPTPENTAKPEPPAAPEPTSKLTWRKKVIELDATATSSVVEAKFHFTNTGKQAVDIRMIEASCGCTTAELEQRHYEPGASGDIVTRFTVGSKVGLQTTTVMVSTSDRQQPTPLTLVVRIPEILRITPPYVAWKHGEEPKDKQIVLEVMQNESFSDITVEPSNTKISVAMRTLVKGRKYVLDITPAQTDETLFATLKVLCKYGETEHTFRAYATVKPRQPEDGAPPAPSPTPALASIAPNTPPSPGPPPGTPSPAGSISSTPTASATVPPSPSTPEVVFPGVPDPVPPPPGTSPPATTETPVATAAPTPDAKQKLRALLDQALPSRRADQWQKVVDIYSQALAVDPNSAEALDERGTAYDALGQSELAKADYRRIILLQPTGVCDYFYRGDAYDSLNQSEKGKAEYQRAVTMDCRTSWDFHFRGVSYTRLEKYDSAVTALNQAVHLDPKLIENFEALGYVRVKQKHYEEAKSDYEKARRLDPNYVYPPVGLGNILYQSGDYAGAVARYTEALGMSPHNANVLFKRGDAYVQQKKYREGVADFDKALGITPKIAYIVKAQVDACNSWGDVYYHSKDYKTAVTKYDKAIQLDPKDPVGWYNRGCAYRQMATFDKAIENLSAAIRLDTRYRAAYNNRGLAYVDSGQTDKGISDFQTALKIEPRNTTVLLNLAYAYTKKGQYMDALNDCNDAILINSKEPLAYMARAQVYRAMGGSGEKKAADDERTARNLGFVE